MPMLSTEYEELLPQPWPEHPDAHFQGWVRGHQHVLDNLDKELLTTIASHQVSHANGVDLNQIGAYFGAIGKRRGRSDAAYRRFLTSIVNSYTGNGTTGAICFAIASGIIRPQSVVDIDEDYEELEYDVTLTDWGDHDIGSLWYLADLADPSCVDMRSLTYDYDTEAVVIAPSEATEVETVTEFEPAVVEVNPSEMATDPDADRGLGSGELSGEGSLGTDTPATADDPELSGYGANYGDDYQ